MALSTSVILGFFTKMFPILAVGVPRFRRPARWRDGGGVGEGEEGKVDWTGTRWSRRGRVCLWVVSSSGGTH
jgi:hypothetical protein